MQKNEKKIDEVPSRGWDRRHIYFLWKNEPGVVWPQLDS
jgi:hypothetical protein